jgi:aminoglycoside phosphotransferase family enzyme/predicted kinase
LPIDRPTPVSRAFEGAGDEALASQARIVAAFARSLRAGGWAVRRFETHVSWVLVAGRQAWKLKKALRTGFLDYGSLALRRRACDEEVRVNRRFAPDLYLGVVALRGPASAPVPDGEGPLLDWAVHMRAFPDDARWDRLARAGGLRRAHVDQLAVWLAGQHAGAPVAGAPGARLPADPVGHALRQRRATLASLRARLTDSEDCRLLAAIAAREARQAPALGAALAQRLAAGRFRECHGDLHLANLLLIDGRPLAFDAIEFDPALRWIDVIADLAFASMDLARHGRADLGRRLVDAYLAESGDYDGARVLRAHQVDRALVRGLVAALRHPPAATARDRPGTAPHARLALAPWRTYLSLAWTLGEPVRPVLFATHGFSGSGKSSRTEGLVEAVGAVRIRADVERKRMHGLSPAARSGSAPSGGIYGAAATEATYARLCELAAPVLAGGLDVVLDATYLRRAHRDRARACARALGVPFAILDFPVARAVLRARVAARAARCEGVSEADPLVLERQFALAEPLGADELRQAHRLRAARPGTRGSAAAWRRLRARVAAGHVVR